MKRIIWLVFTVLSITNIFSQKILNGIGKLKLYSEISILDDVFGYDNYKLIQNSSEYYNYISNDKNCNCSYIYNDTYIKNSKKYDCNTLFQITNADTTVSEINNFNYYYNLDVKQFYIHKYEVVPNLIIEGLKLIFYQGILVSIECKGSDELNKALNLKYGKSKVFRKEHDYTFKYTYTGASFTKTDKEHKYVWNTNSKKISCYRYYYLNHYDNAEEYTYDDFYLIDTNYKRTIDLIEKRIKKRIENRNKAKETHKYDGI